MRRAEQLMLECFVSKRCSRCHEVRPADAFTRHRSGLHGLSDYCRECASTRNKKYYQDNRERILKYPSRRYDPAAYKEWYAANRHKRRARYEAADKARLREQNRRYWDANRERLDAWRIEWRNQNRDRWNDYNYRRRARMNSVQVVEFTPEQLAERWAYYGNRCWVCGIAADSTDHVKPIAKGGAHMLCNLRPICRRCNSAKRDKWPYSMPAAAGEVSPMSLA